ncbi:hypothetical protein BGZ94_000423, partial [Podila epigama]
MATSGLGHHSANASLLLNRNTASRPGSPSSVPTPIPQTLPQRHTHHQHSSSASSDHSAHSNSSGTHFENDKSNYVGRYINEKEDNSSFPTVDVTSGTGPLLGGNFSSKRSRFAMASSGPNGVKRWRWWSFTAAILMAFALVQALVLLVGSNALYSLPDQIQIATRDFRKVTYQGLALDTPASILKKPIQVYHITKEFGPATKGDLGAVVTALTRAQQRARTQKINIVMPYYSALETMPGVNIIKAVSLSLNIKDKNQKTQPMVFQVYRFKYHVPYKPSDMLTNDRPINPITAWLIGPGDTFPFDRAFYAKTMQDIYRSPRGLPAEWRDLYFAKAAATFIQHQNKNDDVSLFAAAAVRGIDVVHVHGASNALVLHYLQQLIDRGAMGEEPPALVYTLHDYSDELRYSNEIVNVQKFMDKNVHSDDEEEDMFLQMDGISPYCHGHRMFTSALGIDLADAVTFVSKTLAKDIVEGRLDFHLKELVLGSILNQAEKNLFIGITNGVDFGKLNPWTMQELRMHNLAFPSLEPADESAAANASEGEEEEEEKVPIGMGSPNLSIRSAKEAAKEFLFSKGLLTEQDLSKPLALFIGRLDYSKGPEFFATASAAIKERGGKFVIMSEPGNFPAKSVYNLERLYKGTVKVFSDEKTQREWDVYWRTAADFLLVPSITENFGLVAAEGLLFGSAVISSGVGGLSEFLVDRPNPNDRRQKEAMAEAEREKSLLPTSTSSMSSSSSASSSALALAEQPLSEAQRQERFNSYLFDVSAADKHEQLSASINDAIRHWQTMRRQPPKHEEFLNRLVNSALSLDWDRPGGPVDQYHVLYEIALSNIGFSD